MKSYITGQVQVSGISVPQVTTELNYYDYLGTFMVRWGFNRNNYRVHPGLYAVGTPGADSDVFVTANYKLSFDLLRKSLAGLNGWILVLDTKGVNVWCAAGKGTFGTKELVNRIKMVTLDKIVHHRRLILPQLGAVGIAAHHVRQESGFTVQYGPVRADDIKRFVEAGYKADQEMRKITFLFHDRIKLIPNDFMYGKFYLLGAIIVMLLLSGINKTGISFTDLHDKGSQAILNTFLAYLSGIVITPMFLPFFPGRPFSLKGFFSGVVVFLVLFACNLTGNNAFEFLSWFFIITAISSFVAMTFTGSSTYTSLSGVKKEMKLAIPLQAGFAVSGIILSVIGKLIG